MDTDNILKGSVVRLEFKRTDTAEWCKLCGVESRDISFNHNTVEKVLQACEVGNDSIDRHLLATYDTVDISASGVLNLEDCFKQFVRQIGWDTDHTAEFRLVFPGLVTYEGTFFIDSRSYQAGVTDAAGFSLSAKNTGAVTATYA